MAEPTFARQPTDVEAVHLHAQRHPGSPAGSNRSPCPCSKAVGRGTGCPRGARPALWGRLWSNLKALPGKPLAKALAFYSVASLDASLRFGGTGNKLLRSKGLRPSMRKTIRKREELAAGAAIRGGTACRSGNAGPGAAPCRGRRKNRRGHRIEGTRGDGACARGSSPRFCFWPSRAGPTLPPLAAAGRRGAAAASRPLRRAVSLPFEPAHRWPPACTRPPSISYRASTARRQARMHLA